jgi:FAD-linked oxidoreductase
MKHKPWKNWAGNVQCSPAELVTPSSLEELVEVVRTHAKRGRSIRVAGSGHSYSSIVSTNGTLISLRKLQGIEAIDQKALAATVLAGTKLRALGDPLWNHGLAMVNLGDTHAQALAGAISTATHGSGIQLGSISTQIAGFTLVTAAGELLECSPQQEPEIFKAAQVSLGSLGVIAKVRLKLLPRYHLREIRCKSDLESVLAGIGKSIHAHRHYEFWYWPDTARASVRIRDTTNAPITENALTRFWEDIVYENLALWLVSALSDLIPSLADDFSRLSARLDAESQKVDRSYRILATPRRVRLTEMEYAVPAEAGPDCLREIKSFIDKSDIPINFPIQYRYVAADDAYLSPYYKQASALIDLQQYISLPHVEYFKAGELIFKKYGGRPHWGKIHYRTAAELRELYPMWDKFHEVRRRLDPHHVFMNDYLREVLGE